MVNLRIPDERDAGLGDPGLNHPMAGSTARTNPAIRMADLILSPQHRLFLKTDKNLRIVGDFRRLRCMEHKGAKPNTTMAGLFPTAQRALDRGFQSSRFSIPQNDTNVQRHRIRMPT